MRESGTQRGVVLASLMGAAAIALVAVVAVTIGMSTAGRADAGPKAESADATTRTYYLAAEPVNWNYAPQRRNKLTGAAFDDEARVFTARRPGRVGSTYRKSRYVAYTDGTFTQRAPVSPNWRHLGILGPAIHAQVGDTIRVVFLNRTPFPASVHPHGVLYDKTSEGAPYADGAARSIGDAVPPGKTFTYTWGVPERAGPGPMDGSSVAWMYHSHVDEIGDTNGGLVGPLIVTGRGLARDDGSPTDVDREIVTFFSVLNENDSVWLDKNVASTPGARAAMKRQPDEFGESNLMHSINGYVYGNGPGYVMIEGERVRWYVISLGTEVDLHSPHWHGNTVLDGGMRSDMVDLLPGDMMVADMTPDAVGTWLFHCHVNDHITAGMSTRYRVLPRP